MLVVLGCDSTGAVVNGPEIITRGFANLAEGHELLEEARRVVLALLAELRPEARADRELLRQRIHAELRRYLRKTVDRRPMILPVIVDVPGGP